MNKIIEFPSGSVRNDIDIERGIREGLAGHGFSKSAIDIAITRVMPLFKESKEILGKGLSVRRPRSISNEQLETLRPEISKAIEKFQNENAQFTQKLILNIAVLVAQSNDV